MRSVGFNAPQVCWQQTSSSQRDETFGERKRMMSSCPFRLYYTLLLWCHYLAVISKSPLAYNGGNPTYIFA